jgi:hypothetical protein
VEDSGVVLPWRSPWVHSFARFAGHHFAAGLDVRVSDAIVKTWFHRLHHLL